MAVNDVTIFRDPDTGDVGLKDKSSGNKFLWSSDRQEWFLEDSSGERAVGGPKGAQNVSATDYSVETKDGNRRLLVETNSDYQVVDGVNTDFIAAGTVSVGQNFLAASVGGFSGGKFYVYDKNTLESVDTVDEFSDSIAWRSDDLVAYNVRNTGKIRLYTYDGSSFNLKQSLTDPNDDGADNITNLDFNKSDDKLVAATSNEAGADAAYIYEVNASTGDYQLSTTLSTSGTNTADVAWNNDGSKLAFTDNDANELKIYNASTLTLTNTVSSIQPEAKLSWRSDNYIAIADIAVSSSADINIDIYDNNYNFEKTITVSSVDGITFAFGGNKKLAVLDDNGRLLVYNFNFDLVKEQNLFSNSINSISWYPSEDNKFATGGLSDPRINVFDVLKNKVDIAADNPDYFETTVVNSGDWIVEIESTDATLNSLVGSEPKIIDQWGEATIKKTGSSEYLVEGDIYKETGDGFTQSL